MLQSFGRPWGASGYWLQSADAIQKLGGNAQIWVQMNQGAVEPPGGAYAFVGRVGMDVPGAESSQWLTKQAADGKLHGLLARGRDDQYEPLLAESGNALNAELVDARQPPVAAGWRISAVHRRKGGRLRVPRAGRAGVWASASTFRGPATCARCTTTTTAWTGRGNRLRSPPRRRTSAPKSRSGFKPRECEAVRSQLVNEVRRRNQVAEYFGRDGLQAPFVGGAQVGVLADVQRISNEIRADVTTPVANNAVSHVLTIVSGVLKVATLSGLVCGPCGTAAGGLSGAVGLAAYLTHQDGSPDIVGPAITSTAANLGGDLLARYQRVSAYLQTEARSS